MLSTLIGSVKLENCIFNASGPRCGSAEALAKIASSNSGAILSKSATLLKNEGNSLPRSIPKINLGPNYCDGSFNSEGLPNLGIEHYIHQDTIKKLSIYSKPYFISLSGSSLDDNCEMLQKVLDVSVSGRITGIELNLACPNVSGKPIIAYDFEQMNSVLMRIIEIVRKYKNKNIKKKDPFAFGIKLAPYLDGQMINQAVDVILKYKEDIDFVTTCNTIGNAMFVDTDQECMSIKGKGNTGLGGVGGGFIKNVALANIRQLYNHFQERGASNIDIIGVGGISTGNDAFQAILCGATAVQVGTCYWKEGPQCFKRIQNELMSIMKAKGYTSIKDFKGKLKKYKSHTCKVNHIYNNEAEVDANRFYMKAVIVMLISVVALIWATLFKKDMY
jgi:dihydroorotate dehydrogenase (fumarate)